MSAKIQFKQREMEQAIAQFRQVSQNLKALSDELASEANEAEQNALQGEAGAALKQAIQGTLCQRIDRLSELYKQHAAVAERELQQMIAAAAKLR
jgi:uncharacterized protein YukE